MSKPKVSKAFYHALSHTSSLCITCDCGVTHFSTSEIGNYDDGVYESLLEKQVSNPAKYISHDEYIPWGNIGNEQIVVDCPCEKDVKYEKFIWSHRNLISRYFQERLIEVKKNHELEIKTLEVFKESDKL